MSVTICRNGAARGISAVRTGSGAGVIRIVCDKHGTTTGLVAVIGNWDPIDGVFLVAFDDGSGAVQRARAFVADAGYGDAADGEMGGGHILNFTAMAGRVMKSDDVHCRCLRWSKEEDRVQSTPRPPQLRELDVRPLFSAICHVCRAKLHWA